jgi:Domain of unknown function (DUF4188)
MIHHDRLAATMKGDFVLFIIGMRINKPFMIHKWLPFFIAMPKMLKALKKHPELGFLHSEMWFSRTILVVQYWNSMEQLLEYAHSKQSEHLSVWYDFNTQVGTNGSVGIWHETYQITAGNYENIYVNMPSFGLGKAGTLYAISEGKQSAQERLKTNV